MKTIACLITGVLSLLCIVRSSSAAVSRETVDSEKVARALLFFSETKHFQGDYYGQKTNGIWTWGTFYLNKRCEMTQLTVDDVPVSIPIDRPFRGLPASKLCLPLYHFSLRLAAVDKNGLTKAYGSYATELLTGRSIIQIAMRPGLVPKFIPFKPPSGVDETYIRMLLDDGSTFWFDKTRQGFQIWLDPFGPDQRFRIIDGVTGTILFIGDVGWTHLSEISSSQTINIGNIGNVVEATFIDGGSTNADTDRVELKNEVCDSTVVSNGVPIRAKVLTADLNYEGGLIVSVSHSNAIIVIKQWSENGDLIDLQIRPMPVDDPSREKSVYTDNINVGKVIITVTGADDIRGFDIRLVRYTWDPT